MRRGAGARRQRLPATAAVRRRGLDRGGGLPPEQLAAYAQHVDLPIGSEPITQGDHGDRFYVIESGDAGVLINGHKVREIGPGDDFGERALLRDTPRTATVRALSEMQLLAVERCAPRGVDR
jgi:CRP-like cAMP-binding protein